MCILLYAKIISCSGFPDSYAQLGEGGVSLPWVYVHSAIYDSYLVYWFSRDLCSIGEEVGVGSICHGYMYILLSVTVIQCSSVA